MYLKYNSSSMYTATHFASSFLFMRNIFLLSCYSLMAVHSGFGFLFVCLFIEN